MAKIPRFEVIALQPLDGMGALRAYASVRIAGKFTVHEWRVIRQDGQAAWVSGPQKSWQDADGKKRYSTLFELHDKEWREALTATILEAMEQHPGGIRQIGSSTPFGQALREKAGIGGGQ